MQTPEGVRVPEQLKPFMLGIDFIPFRKVCNWAGLLRAQPVCISPLCFQHDHVEFPLHASNPCGVD